MLNKKIKNGALRFAAALMALVLAGMLCGCGSDNFTAQNDEANSAANTSASEDGEKAETDEAAKKAVLPEDDGPVQEIITVKASADGTPVSARLKRSDDDMQESVDVSKLPFRIKVSCYLDGSELSPEELAGKSGSLRIRFDYENLSSSSVSVDGNDTESMVPLVFITMVALPEDRFSNVSVEGGSVSTMSDTRIAVGYAVPGIADALGTEALKEQLKTAGEALEAKDSSEDEEDDSIPEYVEISADTVNCRIDFTATMVTGGLLSGTDDGRLRDLLETVEGLDDLGSAGDKLANGASDLKSGAESFASGLGQYVSGVDEVSEAAAQLSSGAEQLASGLEALKQAVSAAQAAGAQGLDELAGSISALSAGAGQLSSGAAALSQGTQTLSSSGEELKNGYSSLQSGISALSSGTSELNSKVLKKLSALSEGALPDTINRLRAMALADGSLSSWEALVGSGQGDPDGSLSFIVETEEIKQP